LIRRVGMGTQWIGPELRGPGGRQVFHQVDPNRQGAAKVLQDALRLHVIFVRADPSAQKSAPDSLARAIAVWWSQILEHVKAKLKSQIPREERNRLSRLLADVGRGEQVAYASLGFVGVLPQPVNDPAVCLLPVSTPPSKVVGHQVCNQIIVARDGQIPKEEALSQAIASRIASGRIPMPPLIPVVEEELPIQIGVTDLDTPVVFHLGSASQASHFAILGPTGRGKTVLAKRMTLQAMQLGVTPVILDTKGEMFKGGRSFLDLPVFSPTSKDAMWPAWSFPVAHRLWQEISARADRGNGKIRITQRAIVEAVDASKDQLTLSSQMLGQLVQFASSSWISLNPSQFATDLTEAMKANLAKALRENPSWLGGLKASSREEAIFGMSQYIAQIGADLLRQRLGQEAVSLLGENAPYQHLFLGSGAPSPLLKQGGIVTFQTLLGSIGDELLTAFYTYVLQLIVSAIVAMRFAGTAPPRVLLYTEEAHRVRGVLDQMMRITRAFGISVLVVTQHLNDLTDEALEQVRGLVMMGPDVASLDALFKRLSIPYPAWPFIREGEYGRGVFVGRGKGVSFPVPIDVKLTWKERAILIGTAPPKEEI
jgi:hypothetical protein